MRETRLCRRGRRACRSGSCPFWHPVTEILLTAANTKQSIRHAGNSESSDYCFADRYCDINHRMNEAGTAMSTEKFDAYGEALPQAAHVKRDAGRPASAILSRVGQYVFWLFVVV